MFTPDLTTTLITGDRVMLTEDLGKPFDAGIRHGFVFRIDNHQGTRLYTCSLAGRMMTLTRRELHRLAGPADAACQVARALLAAAAPPETGQHYVPDNLVA